jgi:hypothetical protein
MKVKKLIAVSSVCLMTFGMAGMAKAAVHVWEDPGQWGTTVFCFDTQATPKFTANELSLDLFGSYEHAEEKISHLGITDIKHHGTWGGGVGVNYFFAPFFGIMGDINIGDNGGNFVDQAMGAGVIRIPIEPIGLAPYVFGGGGRGFDPHWEWLAQVGVGLEWRLNPVTGIFTDARYIFSQKDDDRVLFRAGLRLVF